MRPHLTKLILTGIIPGAALIWALSSVACDPANITNQIPFANLDGAVAGPIDFAYPPRDLMPPPPDMAAAAVDGGRDGM